MKKKRVNSSLKALEEKKTNNHSKLLCLLFFLGKRAQWRLKLFDNCI